MKNQSILKFEHQINFDKNNFLKSECNTKAYNAINNFPQGWNNKILIIYGDSGCGKTHLGNIWKNKEKSYLVDDNEHPDMILEKFEQGADIFIDNINEFTNKWKNDFLYNLYNIAKQENSGYALLTSNKRPSEWDIDLPDARSRILSLNAIEIDQPDDFLLSGVLIKLFNDRQLKVSPNIINYLLIHMERSFNGAVSIVEKIDNLSLTKKRNITVPLIKELFN